MQTLADNNKTFLQRSAMALALAAALAGCANLAPDYAQPAAPVPANWSQKVDGKQIVAATGDQAATNNANADSIGWRQFFLDPRLQQVIAMSLENNRDLRVAALNIEKARAQYRITDADRYPAVSATGSSTASRTPAQLSSSGRATVSHQQSVTVGISAYELDFFGRLKNLSDAALETYQYQVETRRSTHISLVAEVATAWLTLAADRELLKLAQDTLQSQSRTYELSQRSHDIGTVSGVDLASQEATVESARADVAQYTAQVAQDINALRLMAGADLDEALLPQGLPQTASVLLETPAGLPSEVLLRRPDVLAAEHTLKSANADIGAARAAFFPSITLTADGGTASRTLGGLFKPGSASWSFVPSINLPIFNAGSLRASLDSAKITRDIDVANYEKAVQTAFREVADALAVRATLDQRMQAQTRVAAANEKSYRLSEARYRNGIDSYLTTLVSQRSLYSAQQTLISLRLTEQSNRITLYKVLGGGWNEQSQPPQAVADGKSAS
ncbi:MULTISPECIES: efflux transporter outer membrane subunit [unclassified Herbaspirillum]|uniref:efflux transporter outer membrane subunit n=1 Tax=unclassified Herbaspirillum TaxID=2624150 RepID=UPI001152FCF4|nr:MULTISPECIES: efflux transporter outer membrane subunit [unclassified Herbaspirillum]MBB5389980.1 NodT family efflux transporter outer membrane factor (OMF) lipoprotein [Herbaspirillum sp. SJZ102]TQK09512.1 multidrug efflux system outer membrane protein/multidrug efflux system outer membrane protein [Herbaspirillum sp. SJZ130]TQK13801.1 multidrug efflux system outer membrane protein/multidrug efflux system outer membrane protein [Herbaspirillum sp. SJZ106]